ncbi:nuclear transport factor 2 isoform X1 [Raphanus sativus]|uniref:Nuclear transport factor 2 isoform X1 n=1 Tax=Raphanus sativus TaxID=3726 RepID=A0A6J0P6U7_RAPSA|nr:nuclear transport factor 2 isoform X1 [Raphanus sativus]XP_056864670.1 nuclear transport factor 2 isoform X1 [Raphanus sativus]
MAQQEASPSPGAEVVGRAFVEQYYHILHQSPGLVHRFYQDSSLLTRPDATGAVTTVTTMQAINDKIMSLKYENYTAEIETADAQESHERGVIVLVTGRLTGNDNVRKKFSQTFFLAPQDKGYFVLNDVFRFLEEKEVTPPPQAINGTTTRDVQAPVEPERVVVSHEAEVEPEPVASIEEEDLDNVAEVYDPSDKDEGVVVDAEPIEPPPAQISHNEVLPVPQGDAPKHSYASILKLMKSGPAPTQAARNKPRAAAAAPVSTKPKPTAPPAEPAAAAAPENVANSSNVDVEDDGHSIYVRNLPFDTTPTQLEEVFKSFGAIKHEGIQVRSNKQQGFCFGFVEFETSSGKQSALEASPVTIGDRQAVLEEKKTNSRGGGNNGGGRGRYFGGRGSFRNESFKGGRGGGGGRGGYGRGEYSSRPRSSNTRNSGEGYQRVPQNGGSGRGGGGGGRGGPRGGASS